MGIFYTGMSVRNGTPCQGGESGDRYYWSGTFLLIKIEGEFRTICETSKVEELYTKVWYTQEDESIRLSSELFREITDYEFMSYYNNCYKSYLLNNIPREIMDKINTEVDRINSSYSPITEYIIEWYSILDDRNNGVDVHARRSFNRMLFPTQKEAENCMSNMLKIKELCGDSANIINPVLVKPTR